MVEVGPLLNRYLKRVLNEEKQVRSGHYEARAAAIGCGRGLMERLDRSRNDQRRQSGADEIGLGGFRSRSFFSFEVRHSFFSKELARALGERNAYL